MNLLVDYFRSVLRYHRLLKKGSRAPENYSPQKGVNFKIRRDVWDSAVIMESWWFKIYTKHVNLPPDPLIIDVGAHIGAFSVYAGFTFPKSKVFCFEPDLDNFLLLKKNIAQNNLGNVKAYNLAIAKPGQKYVYLTSHPDNFGMHSTVDNYSNQTSRKKVRAVSLGQAFDKYNISSCDLLKLDCEGAEYQALYNTPRQVFNKVQNIVLEYHKTGGDIDRLRKFLESLGFKTRLYQALPIPLLGGIINLPILHAAKKPAN
jgi:FkbM family methyltransferase